jgi:hypothetical protein
MKRKKATMMMMMERKRRKMMMTTTISSAAILSLLLVVKYLSIMPLLTVNTIKVPQLLLLVVDTTDILSLPSPPTFPPQFLPLFPHPQVTSQV